MARDAAEGSSPDTLVGDFREEAFHQIQPGSAGRGEMPVVAGVGSKPGPHRWMGVGAVAIEDQMNRESVGCGSLDPFQKAQKLLMTMAGYAVAQHLTAQHVQGREQSRGSGDGHNRAFAARGGPDAGEESAGCGPRLGSESSHPRSAPVAGGGPVALTLGPSFSPIFADYTASAAPINFDITTLPGGMGTDLLNGTLSLVDFAQVGNSGMTNTSAAVDMTITSGTLMADYPGNKGKSQLTIDLTGLGFLPSLATATATTLRSATLDALVTPEPRTILLYGSGLVLFGIMLRRRLTAQS